MRRFFTLVFALSTLFVTGQRGEVNLDSGSNTGPMQPKDNREDILLPGSWDEVERVGIYRWVDDDNPIGWIFGNNTYDDRAVGQKFDIDGTRQVTGAYFWVGAKAFGVNDLVHFNVHAWNGSPGEVLGSISLPLNSIVEYPIVEGVGPGDFQNAHFVEFSDPVEVENEFFMSIDFSDLPWSVHEDGLGMVTSLAGDGGDLNYAYIQNSFGLWETSQDVHSALVVDLGIFPVVTHSESHNVMRIADAEAQTGSNATISLEIDNNNDFVAFQLDIQLPEGSIYQPGSIALNSDRAEDHDAGANVREGNVLRILAYSLTNTPFSGSSGEVLSFQIQSPVEPDLYNLEISNAVISDAAGQNILTATENGQLDVTGDGVVTVNSIEELRQQEANAETIYRLSSEAVITHMHNQRNQKYIQDATAAVLIDDPLGVITTEYEVYDGITGVKGTLSYYENLLQFLPLQDPGLPTSSGNIIEPLELTLNDLNPELQSQLVVIEYVEFDATSGDFLPSNSYDITDPSGSGVLRTPSENASLDYFHTPIPQEPVRMTALVSQWQSTMQVFPRSFSDMETYPEPEFALNLLTDPEGAGTLSGAGDYTEGTIVEVAVEPQPGWHFVNWTLDSEIVSVDTDFEFEMPAEEVTLTANFLKELTISGLTIAEKIYDTQTHAEIEDFGTLEGLIDVNHEVSIDEDACEAHFDNANVGADKPVQITNLQLTGADAHRYIIEPELWVTGVIAPAMLELSNFVADSKTYDGNTSVSGDDFQDNRYEGDVLLFAYQVAFEDATAGEEKQVLFAEIMISGGDDASNYTLSSATGVAIADIYPKELTIEGSFTVADKEWDGTTEAQPDQNNLVLVEPVEGDEVTMAGLQLEFAQTSPGDDIPVSIAAAHLDGDAAPNYILSLAGAPVSTGTITPKDFLLTIEFNGQGTVQVDGQEYTEALAVGNYSTLELLAIPDEDYGFLNWTIDQEVAGTEETLGVAMPSHDLTLTVNFVPLPRIITATATEGGSIDPAGEVSVEYGADQTFEVIPGEGYNIHRVLVNGVNQGAVESYTFQNVVTNHTIHAEFVKKTYLITATSGVGGSITPSGNVVVEHGEDVTFDIEALTGYEIADLTVDDESVGATESYTFENVTQNHTIEAQFDAVLYTLTYLAGDNGGISGETPQNVPHGGSGEPVLAVPFEGYHFTQWSDENIQNPRTDQNVTDNLEVTAFFAANTYQITATSNPEAGGSVEGAGSYQHGQQVSLLALPNSEESYEFVSWTENGQVVSSDPLYEFEATANRELTANFALESQFNVILARNPTQGGTVSGGGSYFEGEEVTISATPAVGYVFSGWTGYGQTTENPHSFTMPAQTVSFTANFGRISYNISATASQGGTINPQGNISVFHGDDQSFNFLPQQGYFLQDVLVDGVSQGDIPSYVFENVQTNHTIHAVFAVHTYQLHYSAGDNGSIQGDTQQTVVWGQDGSPVEAVPDEGYHFVQWSDGLTQNPRTDLDVTQDISVTAEFDINSYQITATSNPQVGGNVTGAGIYTHNQQVSLQANAANFYTFAYWSEDGQIVSTESTYTFAATSHRNLVANFMEQGQYQVNLFGDPAQGGQVSGGGFFYAGEMVTITAEAAPTYDFEGWSSNWEDNEFIEESVVTFEMPPHNLNFTALFQLKTYIVSASSSYGGSIDPTGEIEVIHGEDITFNILPNEGFFVERVLVDGINEGALSSYTFEQVTSNRSIHAVFDVFTYILTYHAGENGTISGDSPQTVEHGANGTPVEAIPDEGYEFVQWSDGVTDNPRTDENVTADLEVTAEFAILTYTLTYLVGENGTISGDSPQTVEHGADGTPVEAIPNEGYEFVQWGDGVTDNPRTDENLTADLEVTAEFAILTYTLTYLAGENGTISGDSPQTVEHGTDGTPVEAIPDQGYEFVQWSDGVTDNPRTDENVTADLEVTAEFAILTYTLTYLAGENGTISGDSPQTVEHGTDGTPVEAIPDQGYEFVQWSDGVTDNPRTDENVTADLEVTAAFGLTPPPVYTLTILIEPQDGGTASGEGEYQEGAEVILSAVPAGEYEFVRWEDQQGEELGTDEELLFVMPAHDVSVTAVFDIPDAVVSNEADKVVMYPNPARDLVTIASSRSLVQEVKITAVQGNVVYRNTNIHQHDHQINTSHLNPGVYLVRIVTENGYMLYKLQIVR